MAKKKQDDKINIEQYEHTNQERLNNPPVGLVTAHSDNGGLRKKNYEYDPHIDPQLQWAGKKEHTSFEVNTVSLHVHERIDPRKIIETVRKDDIAEKQHSLFESFQKPLRQAVEFYKHREGWTNRLVAGDSLLVMNSLIEKEAMAGKVQMIYFDPPYGIKYGSNFQPFTNKRDVKDGKDEDLTAEPEMIKAFRDTWELGIHSYLTYLRDRLLLARDMLSESGSIFVQIGDENIHLVRTILDEIFGSENFISHITVKKTAGLGANLLPNVADFILWYSKDKLKLKFRNIYVNKELEGDSAYNMLELENGERRKLTFEEWNNHNLLPKNSKVFRHQILLSSGSTPSCIFPIEFGNQTFYPTAGRSWATNPEGIKKLIQNKRISKTGTTLSYIRYANDFPINPISNVFTDTASGSGMNKIYVVQTNDKVIQRCLLMTTDPGDLVLDITCGSGTTAFVAEQWGRRWITCDTSRVAITLAKQRLMTALFDYYELAQPTEGVGSGFKYKTVPHITLKSIANNEPAPQETLYDQPIKDNKRLRVTGPFTVEAVPSPVAVFSSEEEVFSSEFSVFSEDETTQNKKLKTQNSNLSEEETKNEQLKTKNEFDTSISRTGETLRQDMWRDELQRAGVRAKGGKLMQFIRIEPLAGTRYLQAEGELKTENKPLKTVICFGPEHAPLEQRTVELALEEAAHLFPKPEIVLFCAFQFDEEAAKDIDETNWQGVTLLKAQMNADLFTDDLKKKRSSNESFWLIGQPDVKVISFEFLVFSREFSVFSKDETTKNQQLKTQNTIETQNEKLTTKNILANYDTFKKLSGLNSLAEINGLSNEDILLYSILSQGRNVWNYLADEKGWCFNTEQHSRRTTKKLEGGVPSVSWNSSRLIGGIGNTDNDFREFGIHTETELRAVIEQLRRDSKVVSSIKEISGQLGLQFTKNQPLKTKNYTEVEILGFDYYNPKTGTVESGGKSDIAMWLLDTDYDGRSIFPSQIFFPMAGTTEGWSKLAKNLKAEIDEEKIEAFYGTISLPFTPGQAVAVKIIDARGIESLKIIRL